MVTVSDIEELRGAVMHAKAEGLRVHLLGGGTNTYFGEDLSAYLFIALNFKGILFDRVTGEVTASASENWDTLVLDCVKKALWGIENLSLIPGTVGAAPIQNIGAYGVEFKDVCTSVTVFYMETLEEKEFDNATCQFGYRDSVFKHEIGRYIVTKVRLQLSKDGIPTLTYKPLDSLVGKEVSLQEIRDMVVASRQTKLPDWGKYPNDGSFFKNPTVTQEVFEEVKKQYPEIPVIPVANEYKIPTAWLIEHVAEMKGVQRGDVGTWPNQPLVIVNYGAATAHDVDSLAGDIQTMVYQKTGIHLEQEVNKVG